jgi:hypothetical protein
LEKLLHGARALEGPPYRCWFCGGGKAARKPDAMLKPRVRAAGAGGGGATYRSWAIDASASLEYFAPVKGGWIGRIGGKGGGKNGPATSVGQLKDGATHAPSGYWCVGLFRQQQGRENHITWGAKMGIVLTGVLIVAALIALAEWRNKVRRQTLLAKYGDLRIVGLIMSKSIWEGQSTEQLVDSIGSPVAVDESRLKTKTKQVWKYNQASRGFRTKVIIENGVVVGWDQKG